MLASFVLCGLLAVVTAQDVFPPVVPTTCAATLCIQGTRCEEFIDPDTGLVQARCVDIGSGPSQKVGRCPRLRYGFAGICASNCARDGDCVGTQKCCRNPCGALTCQDPVYSPITRPSCRTVRCAPGTECVLEQPQCVRAPCFPVPTCVPITRPSCRTVRCAPGTECVLQQVQCVRAPCFPVPTCVPIGFEKPGVCPAIVLGQRGPPCGPACTTDANCFGSEKCCKSFSCGSSCTVPEPEFIIEPTSCDQVDCRSGFECQETPIPCLVPPCPTRPECVKTVIVLPSPADQCPVFPAVVVDCPRRFNECRVGSAYSRCRPGTICCSLPCGNSCIVPRI